MNYNPALNTIFIFGLVSLILLVLAICEIIIMSTVIKISQHVYYFLVGKIIINMLVCLLTMYNLVQLVYDKPILINKLTTFLYLAFCCFGVWSIFIGSTIYNIQNISDFVVYVEMWMFIIFIGSICCVGLFICCGCCIIYNLNNEQYQNKTFDLVNVC